jgi:chromosome segregation ATPase
MKQRIFNSFKDLEQITSEMAGVNEFQSNATGKEEVDSLYKKYSNAQMEYDNIQKIIDDSQLEIEQMKEWLLLHPTAIDRETGKKTQKIAELQTLININNTKLNKLKADIAIYKRQYESAKSIYDKKVAEEQRIEAEAFKAEQELKAAENARIYGEQTQKRLEDEAEAEKQRLAKKEKTKKLIIGSVVGLLLIGGIVIGIKKGWFKK